MLDAGSFVQPQIFVSSFLLQFFDGDRVIDMNIASTGKATSFEGGLRTLFKPNSILMSLPNVFTMVTLLLVIIFGEGFWGHPYRRDDSACRTGTYTRKRYR